MASPVLTPMRSAPGATPAYLPPLSRAEAGDRAGGVRAVAGGAVAVGEILEVDRRNDAVERRSESRAADDDLGVLLDVRTVRQVGVRARRCRCRRWPRRCRGRSSRSRASSAVPRRRSAPSLRG